MKLEHEQAAQNHELVRLGNSLESRRFEGHPSGLKAISLDLPAKPLKLPSSKSSWGANASAGCPQAKRSSEPVQPALGDPALAGELD